MAGGPQAPVDEVVLSVVFEHNSCLVGPRLGLSLSKLLEDYPKIEQQPAYEMPIEPLPGAEPIPGAGIRFQLLHGDNIPQPRSWLITEDDTQLVQIQPDYLALNWRRRTEDQEYPGYLAILAEFQRVYGELSSAIERQQGSEIKPIRAEITYIDVLSASELWRDYSDTHRVISLSFADETKYESLSFTYSKALLSEAGEFLGRMHVGAQPAIVMGSGKQVLRMAITARSTQFAVASQDSMIEFFNLAHQAVLDTFTSMTTHEARKSWGLE